MLSLLISAKFMLYTCFQQAQKYNLRHNTLSSSTKLLTIELSENELFKNTKGREWRDNGKELVINQLYYEVISIQFVHQHWYLLIKEDNFESALIALFSNDEENGADQGTLSKLLLSEYQLPKDYLLKVHATIHYNTWQTYSDPIAKGHLIPIIKPPVSS
jgi:hypothetical protein